MNRIEYELNGIKHSFLSQNPMEIEITKEQSEYFEKLDILFKKWIEFTNQNNIEWWATDGTLLGAIRQNGYITYDDDIDVGITFETYLSLLNKRRELHRQGFKLSKATIGLRFHKIGETVPFLDVVVYDLNPSNETEMKMCAPIVNGEKTFLSTNVTFPKESFKVEDLYPLKEHQFESYTIKIPKNSEDILRRIYSEDCITNCINNTCPLHQNTFAVELEEFISDFVSTSVTTKAKDSKVINEFSEGNEILSFFRNLVDM